MKQEEIVDVLNTAATGVEYFAEDSSIAKTIYSLHLKSKIEMLEKIIVRTDQLIYRFNTGSDSDNLVFEGLKLSKETVLLELNPLQSELTKIEKG